MKKIMKYFILALVLLSCERSNDPDDKPNYKFLTEIESELPDIICCMNVDYYITYWYPDAFRQSLVSGRVLQKPSECYSGGYIDGGDMVICDTLLEYKEDGSPHYGRGISSSDFMPNVGRKSRWYLEGNEEKSIPGFDTTLYCPDWIEFETNPDYNERRISKFDELLIKWNPDEKNNKPIEIIVSPESQKIDDVAYYITEDDGEFLLDLSNLKSKNIIVIVKRYNYLLILKDGHYFWLSAITESTLRYTLIENN